MDPLASGSKAGDGDGDGGDGDGGGGGRIFPVHPGPIPNAPRDNISRKGIPSLRHLFTCLVNNDSKVTSEWTD